MSSDQRSPRCGPTEVKLDMHCHHSGPSTRQQPPTNEACTISSVLFVVDSLGKVGNARLVVCVLPTGGACVGGGWWWLVVVGGGWWWLVVVGGVW